MIPWLSWQQCFSIAVTKLESIQIVLLRKIRWMQLAGFCMLTCRYLNDCQGHVNSGDWRRRHARPKLHVERPSLTSSRTVCVLYAQVTYRGVWYRPHDKLQFVTVVVGIQPDLFFCDSQWIKSMFNMTVYSCQSVARWDAVRSDPI